MTALETDIAAMHFELDTFPDDWTLRLVLADALEEAGRSAESAYQRWAVENKIHPKSTDSSWVWSDALTTRFGGEEGTRIFWAMQGQEYDNTHTRQGNELCLLKALIKLGIIKETL